MEQQGLQPSGGQPGTTTPPAVASGDGWADAEAAYNSEPTGFEDIPNLIATPEEKGAQGSQPAKVEQPATPGDTQIQAAPKDPTKPEVGAPVDPEGTNLWSTEGLQTPEQYQTHLKKVQAWSTKKTQEAKQRETEVIEAHGNLSNLVTAVLSAADPVSALKSIVSQYGPDLEQAGIRINHDTFRTLGQQPSGDGKTPPPPRPDQDVTAHRDAYVDGVRKAFIGEGNKDPDALRFGTAMGETLFQMESRFQAAIKNLSQQIREETVKETETRFKPYLQKAEHEARTTSWGGAISEVEGVVDNDPTLTGFKEAVTKVKGNDGRESTPLFDFIMSQPALKSLVISINKNPQEMARQGWTHSTLLRHAFNNWPQAYEMREKALRTKIEKDLQSKLRSQTELPGSHSQTINPGGDDWDVIEKEIGDPFRTR